MAIVGQKKIKCPTCERYAPVLMKMKPGDSDEHETIPNWGCCGCDATICVFCYTEHMCANHPAKTS